jgi:hypothetical protein
MLVERWTHWSSCGVNVTRELILNVTIELIVLLMINAFVDAAPAMISGGKNNDI